MPVAPAGGRRSRTAAEALRHPRREAAASAAPRPGPRLAVRRPGGLRGTGRRAICGLTGSRAAEGGWRDRLSRGAQRPGGVPAAVAARQPAHGLPTWHDQQARRQAGSEQPAASAAGRAQPGSRWAQRSSECRPLARQDGTAALCRAQPWSAPPDASAGSHRVHLPSAPRACRPATSLPRPAALAARLGRREPAAYWRRQPGLRRSGRRRTAPPARHFAQRLARYLVQYVARAWYRTWPDLAPHLARHWPASPEVSPASPSAGSSRSAASAPCPAGSARRAAWRLAATLALPGWRGRQSPASDCRPGPSSRSHGRGGRPVDHGVDDRGVMDVVGR